MQRSIELLDKVLSEYDEHEVEGEGGGGGGGGGVGGGLATDCSSSTEPSIGLTPDDESPSLGECPPSRVIVHFGATAFDASLSGFAASWCKGRSALGGGDLAPSREFDKERNWNLGSLIFLRVRVEVSS